MQVLDKKITNTLESSENLIFSPDRVFLDIETTGLSKKFSKIYMIGIAFRSMEDDTIIIRQYFADMIREERRLLNAFTEDMEKMHIDGVITFNGDRFDLPFIEERCREHGIDFDFKSFESIDIYKICHRHKNLLGLGSCRQKAIEEFLGLYREDEYNGGQLIKVYEDYEKAPSEEVLQLLLLHNFEDVKDMLRLLVMNRFDVLAETQISVERISEESSSKEPSGFIMLFQGTTGISLPHAIRIIEEGMHIILEKDKIKGAIVPKPMTLFHFLPNPKEYWYLPDEDMVIPRILGDSIDPSRRQPANKNNCRIKEENDFLLLPKGFVPSDNVKDIPVFQQEYASKDLYITAEDIRKNPAVISDITGYLIKKKR